jgi:hypothetical protein
MADVDANRKRGAPGVQVATLGPSDGTGVLAGDLVTPNDNPVVVKPMVASPSAKRDQKGLKKDGEQEGNNKIWISGLQAGVPPGAMKTMSHNCRGAGDPATVREIRDLVGKYKPVILCLLETQIVKRRVEGLARMIGLIGVLGWLVVADLGGCVCFGRMI